MLSGRLMGSLLVETDSDETRVTGPRVRNILWRYLEKAEFSEAHGKQLRRLPVVRLKGRCCVPSEWMLFRREKGAKAPRVANFIGRLQHISCWPELKAIEKWAS